VHNDKGDSLPKDEVKAATYYARACEVGDAVACADLGVKYQTGEGVARDPAHAVALFLKRCRSFIPACPRAADAFLLGDVVEASDARALGLFTQACDAHDS